MKHKVLPYRYPIFKPLPPYAPFPLRLPTSRRPALVHFPIVRLISQETVVKVPSFPQDELHAFGDGLVEEQCLYRAVGVEQGVVEASERFDGGARPGELAPIGQVAHSLAKCPLHSFPRQAHVLENQSSTRQGSGVTPTKVE